VPGAGAKVAQCRANRALKFWERWPITKDVIKGRTSYLLRSYALLIAVEEVREGKQ